MKKLLLVLLALVLVLSAGCAKSDPQRPQLTDEEWGFVFEQTEKANVSPVSDLSRGYSRKRTHFEREGLKPLLVAIKH